MCCVFASVQLRQQTVSTGWDWRELSRSARGHATDRADRRTGSVFKNPDAPAVRRGRKRIGVADRFGARLCVSLWSHEFRCCAKPQSGRLPSGETIASSNETRLKQSAGRVILGSVLTKCFPWAPPYTPPLGAGLARTIQCQKRPLPRGLFLLEFLRLKLALHLPLVLQPIVDPPTRNCFSLFPSATHTHNRSVFTFVRGAGIVN
jgi:hypothetical protein